MKKHWYEFVGVTEENVKGWSEAMGDDFNLYKIDENESLALLKLTPIESIKMRLYLTSINIKNHCKFNLKRL